MGQLGTFLLAISHIAQVHLKHKPPIKQSLEIIYSFMVAKYGNIISLMEAQINGICCKVSVDGFYELEFLRHTLVAIMTSANVLGDIEEHIWSFNEVINRQYLF